MVEGKTVGCKSQAAQSKKARAARLRAEGVADAHALSSGLTQRSSAPHPLDLSMSHRDSPFIVIQLSLMRQLAAIV